ncbi:sensor histidine kinase [Streptomyces niveus]|uniref:sensor histidine kinase n=1 Tax=Streptomyces niveus TaxID=193462 RepID=UPI00133159AD|nr:sensor histidine kinase [Streptomyces niveus]
MSQSTRLPAATPPPAEEGAPPPGDVAPPSPPPSSATPPPPFGHRVRILRRLTVQGWFLLAVAALCVMTLVAGGVAAAMLARTTDTGDHLIDEVSPARTQAFRLQAALLDQETGVRGYLLTKDEDVLEPYRRGMADEAVARERLRELVDGLDRPVADLRAIDRAAREWRADFADPALAGEDIAGGGDEVASVTGAKLAFDRVRAALDAQQAHLGDEQRKARAAFADARSDRDRALVAALVAFLLTGVAITVLVHFTVVRPLDTVRAASRRVAGGDFDHAIPAHGPADLRTLAETVEGMRLRVVSELATSRSDQAELARQAAELDAAAVELRRSNAELEQFAYVASHDLQEPLRKVASFCQLLEKRYGDQLDDRATQYIGFAVDGAKRMQVLINDLLTFSRVGRVQDAQEEVALDAALDRALRNVSVSIEETGAVVERPAELPEVMGDPTLLTMLWQNLLGNAVKFRHPDRAPHITVAVDRAEGADSWTFSVTDNGIGIPEEFAEKVFIIFQRLHARDAYAGTGIGLSLCKKVVEHSGGHIWIDTAHTGGARIAFTLPAQQPPPATEPPSPATAEITATTATTEGSTA